MALDREQYVEAVAREAGFHTPPDDVRRLIESLYANQYVIWRAAERVREYLDLKRAYPQ